VPAAVCAGVVVAACAAPVDASDDRAGFAPLATPFDPDPASETPGCTFAAAVPSVDALAIASGDRSRDAAGAAALIAPLAGGAPVVADHDSALLPTPVAARRGAGRAEPMGCIEEQAGSNNTAPSSEQTRRAAAAKDSDRRFTDVTPATLSSSGSAAGVVLPVTAIVAANAPRTRYIADNCIC